jgi:hypothetical protein
LCPGRFALEEKILAAQRKPTVAEYLAAQISLSGKSQADIAREVGYERSNVVNMMKQGTLKLPRFFIHADPAQLAYQSGAIVEL